MKCDLLIVLFGRYENAYPLVSSYNIKTNQGTISFHNFTFANINTDDVIATEEIVFHKYLEALRI